MTATTPADHIRSLQRDRPKQPMDMATAREAMAGFDVATNDEIAEAVRTFNEMDYAERLLAGIRPRFAPTVLAIIDSGRIAVGEIEETSVGAFSVALETGHAVILHRATHKFIYRVARIFSTRFTVAEAAELAVPLEETARIMAEAFWWYQETGRAFGPDYPITTDQLHLANLLTYETMAFLLCHEIAHALVDQEASAAYLAEAEAAPHLDEHGADVLGAMLALGLGTPEDIRPSNEMALSYAGVEFALQTFAVLEELGVTFADSHPAARQRLNLIQAVISERCNEQSWQILTSLSRGVDHIFASIARIIVDPSEHAAFFERQAQCVAADLDAALEACATVPVPDYATFYQRAGEIVERGYPHQFLSRIAEVTAEFHQSLGSTEAGLVSQRVTRFQKFKLLVGWIDGYLNEPARSVFQAALKPLR